jgi:hypothetical protein
MKTLRIGHDTCNGEEQAFCDFVNKYSVNVEAEIVYNDYTGLFNEDGEKIGEGNEFWDNYCGN